MGNSTSNNKADLIKYQNFVANYQFLRKIKDPRYGEITVLEDKASKELVSLKEVMSKSSVDFNKEMTNLKSRSKITHPNVIKLIGYTHKSEDNLCASFYKFLLIIEYLEMDIEREIIKKKTEDQYYLEEQLWYVADSLAGALSVLQQNNIVHGDLKPGNILISKTGVYKIAEQSIVGNAMPSYHQRLSGYNDVKCYLSPHLVKELQKQNLKPKHNPYKSDVFSLGMVLLHAASLQSCDRFYKWDSFTIDQKEIEQRISSLKLKYSESLQNLLRDMLNFNEDARPDFVELNKKILSSERVMTEPTIPSEKPIEKISETTPIGDSPEKENVNISRDSRGGRLFDTPPKPVADTKVDEPSPPLAYRQTPYGNDSISQEGFSFAHQDPQRDLQFGVPGDQHSVQSVQTSSKGGRGEIEHKSAPPRPSGVSQQSVLAAQDPNVYRPTDEVAKIIAEYRGKVEYQNPLQQSTPQTYVSPTPVVQAQPPTTYQFPTPQYQPPPPQYGQYAVQYYPQPQYQAYPVPVQSQPPQYYQQQPIPTQSVQYQQPQPVITTVAPTQYVVPQQIQPQPQPQQHAWDAQATTASVYVNTQPSPYNTIPSNTYSVSSATFPQQQAVPVNNNSPTTQTQPPGPTTITTYNFGGTSSYTYTPSEEVAKILKEFKGANLYLSNGGENSQQQQITTTTQQPQVQVQQPIQQQQHHEQVKSSGIPHFTTSNLQVQQQQQPPIQQHQYQAAPVIQQQQQITTSTQQYQPTPSSTQQYQQTPSTQSYHQQTPSTQSYQQTTYQPTTSVQSDYNSKPTSQHVYQQQSGYSYSDYKPNSSVDYTNQPLPQTYVHQQQPSYQNQSYQQQQPESYRQQETDKSGGYSNLGGHSHQGSISGLSEKVTEHYMDGSIYEGEKYQGLRHGKGKFYYSDGGMYDGDWRSGSMDGVGTLFYAGGNVAYKGEWKEDKFHGKGIVYNEAPVPPVGGFDYSNFDNLQDYWIRYEGDFVNDNKDGVGILYITNGERYQGAFKDDMVHGRGAYMSGDGRKVNGDWWNNRLTATY
jgi:serine/threonine protein kinase